MNHLTPKEIVAELDRFIIGQNAAKRAVAVAIRNRWRRRQLPADMAREVNPKNIIMIGPTGVGKTEIARRLASLTGAPFIKVEASRFTEVGYHGRDVESMVRDLVEQAINMVRAEQATQMREKATSAVAERLLDILLPGSRPASGLEDGRDDGQGLVVPGSEDQTRRRLREQLDAGRLDDREIELTISSKPQAGAMFANMGLDQMDPDMAGMFERLMPEKSRRRRLTVAEARRVLLEQETDKLLDNDKITAEALERTCDSGIIFLDEIDKIASPSDEKGKGYGGPDVSRQGVQRDLLPIVEGTTVTTRHGPVETDHILFIAAGAFHVAAVSDLMPELQGRFPIRVELSPLTKADFVRILSEPRGALTRQQQALLEVEGLKIEFEPGAIDAMADLAAQANAQLADIGARRLMTIVERVFEELHFDAPELAAKGETKIKITSAFVHERVGVIGKQKGKGWFSL
ncbi:MAG: ATP-dependent protease ATPase subunit HslU [Planctomycetota bacterium]|nr:ATP-dependent protease ATPase subunit HslU [Planctomycetota bacterium]